MGAALQSEFVLKEHMLILVDIVAFMYSVEARRSTVMSLFGELCVFRFYYVIPFHLGVKQV